MRGMCSASETSTTDLLEVLAMKWLLDLAQVVDAQREQRDGRHEVVAGNSEAVCRALGLQRVEPLLFWRGGRVALHDVVETLTTDSPFGFLTAFEPGTACSSGRSGGRSSCRWRSSVGAWPGRAPRVVGVVR